MQAILVTHLPATNTKPHRVKATCERGSLTYGTYTSLEGDELIRHVVCKLTDKFCQEDFVQYGTPQDKNPWSRPFVIGGLPGNKGSVAVFVS